MYFLTSYYHNGYHLLYLIVKQLDYNLSIQYSNTRKINLKNFVNLLNHNYIYFFCEIPVRKGQFEIL